MLESSGDCRRHCHAHAIFTNTVPAELALDRPVFGESALAIYIVYWYVEVLVHTVGFRFRRGAGWVRSWRGGGHCTHSGATVRLSLFFFFFLCLDR